MTSANSLSKSLFEVHYKDPKDGELKSLKARSLCDSTLGLSFIRISDFVFDTQSVVVRPSEEQLKKRLENVKSLHLSIYSIISIEELSETMLEFEKDKSNLVVLPSQSTPPPSPDL